MSESKRRMAEFLAQVSEWNWDRFIEAESDMSYTTSQSVVLSLVRACAMENLSAIKAAIGRLDGKVETPVRVLMPKVYYLYPNAEEALRVTEVADTSVQVIEIEADTDPVPESPTKGFRETIGRMADYPRDTPKTVIEAQNVTEDHMRRGAPLIFTVPQVKAVVAARILRMAQNLNIDAMGEVMDQLDGKLVETVRVVGEDMFIAQFSKVAPPGAYRNGDGVWQVEATKVQDMWRQRLDATKASIVQE